MDSKKTRETFGLDGGELRGTEDEKVTGASATVQLLHKYSTEQVQCD